MKMRFLKWVAAVAFAIGGPLAHAGTVTYVYTDPQGTPLAEADASGTITATFDYKPYGSQALGSPKAGPGYTGHVNDPDTGFVYMQARYYDPVGGRFLSVDPVGPAPGNVYSFNRYCYANNNPVMNIDPDGRLPQWLDHLVPKGDLFRTAGEAIGADAAFVVGVATNDRQLQATAVEGMQEATSGGSGSEAVVVLATMGEGAEGETSASTTLRENVAQGKAGEALTRAKYGDQIAGEQVTIKTSDGTRTRTDFVTKNQGVIETKTGGANLSKGQTKLFNDINAGREVTPVGKNATNSGLKSGQPTVLKSCTIDRC